MSLPVKVQELRVRVPVPLVQGLVGIKPLVVPLVEGGQAGLGAVSDHEEPVRADLKGLHVVGFGDLGDLDVLELAELALVLVKLVDVGSPEELGHDDEDLVLDHHRLAAHHRLTWKVTGT